MTFEYEFASSFCEEEEIFLFLSGDIIRRCCCRQKNFCDAVAGKNVTDDTSQVVKKPKNIKQIQTISFTMKH